MTGWSECTSIEHNLYKKQLDCPTWPQNKRSLPSNKSWDPSRRRYRLRGLNRQFDENLSTHTYTTLDKKTEIKNFGISSLKDDIFNLTVWCMLKWIYWSQGSYINRTPGSNGPGIHKLQDIRRIYTTSFFYENSRRSPLPRMYEDRIS